MFIGIVGGMDRQAAKLVDIGRSAGCEVECHTGHLNGSATVGGLRTLIERSDLVVIVTDLNSHNAVRLARRLASRAHRPAKLVRRMGASQFAALVQEWQRGAGRTPRHEVAGSASGHGGSKNRVRARPARIVDGPSTGTAG